MPWNERAFFDELDEAIAAATSFLERHGGGTLIVTKRDGGREQSDVAARR